MKLAIIDNPDALFWASFNSFELRLPGAAVAAIHQQGDNMPAVKEWAPAIRAQMEKDNFPNKPTPDKIRAELSEYGAWDEAELADDEANWLRLVWCAAHDVAEDDAPDCSAPVRAGGVQ